MASSGMGGVSQGPSPWWTQSQGGGVSGQSTLANLQNNAPAGYTYDPVQMRYVHSPTQAGTALNQFSTAALGGSFNGLLNAAGMGGTGLSGSSGTTPGIPGGSPGSVTPGSTVPNIAPINNTASNNAIYAGAKDTAGAEGRASLDSLRGILGETGQLGSGAEAQGARDIVENAAGEVGKVNRGLAETSANQALSIAQANQQSGLTQRGQDIQAQEAAARLAQEQAQMQFNNMLAQQNQQLQLLKMALGGGSSLSMGGSFQY